MLTDPDPSYQLEVHDHPHPSRKFGGPIGLDGLYRKGRRTTLGVRSAKGTWLNDNTFVIDLQYIGSDHRRGEWVLTFDDARLNLRGKDGRGHDVSIDGEFASEPMTQKAG
jgi:hypothetical protein